MEGNATAMTRSVGFQTSFRWSSLQSLIKHFSSVFKPNNTWWSSWIVTAVVLVLSEAQGRKIKFSAVRLVTLMWGVERRPYGLLYGQRFLCWRSQPWRMTTKQEDASPLPQCNRDWKYNILWMLLTVIYNRVGIENLPASLSSFLLTDPGNFLLN